MNDFAFLAYILDPFGIAEPRLLLSNSVHGPKEVNIRELVDCPDQIVTFDVARLIGALTDSGLQRLPLCMIDIRDALKLLSGTSRDDGGELLWDVTKALAPYFENSNNAIAFEQLIAASVEPPQHSDLSRILSAANLAIRDLWSDLIRDLRANGEEQRFLDIEVPVQQIFLVRQFIGIRLNISVAQALLESSRREKYEAFRDLAEILGFSPAGLTFFNIAKFLAKTDASHLGEFGTQSNLRDYFEIARHSSLFADAFMRYKSAERDESILVRAGFFAGRVFPTFSCFGTVTSRILVAEPRLQELRKRFRGIINAEAGMHLLYFDYAQFEPGILASMAGDSSFKSFYENGDLYRSLSVAIFKTNRHRDLCKRIFLAYCYGMKLTSIAKLLAGANSSLEQATGYHEAVSAFFSQFPRLEIFRQTAQAQLQSRGFASSLFGNRRVRKSSGLLTSKEQRWALNQVVQGTASLIFKTALINLAKKFGADSILLPMHDAVLMQYRPVENRLDKVEQAAVAIMQAAFQQWCPNVVPRVVVSAFAEPFNGRMHEDRPGQPQLDLPFLE